MDIFNKLKETLSFFPFVYDAAAVIVICLICTAVAYITKKVIIRSLLRFLNKPDLQAPDCYSIILAINSRFSFIVPAVLFYLLARTTGNLHPVLMTIIARCSAVMVTVTFSRAAAKSLDLVNYIYNSKSNNAEHPIKGYLQLAKIFIYVIALIISIAILMDKSPVLLLSGIGALAAVLMLIFQDTILSVVASVQLNSNNMLKVGDWIAIPGDNVDGDVIEIALHTVKVQNWDKTIVMIPTRSLISKPFTNWRGMFESGGRRIKRSIHIDQQSIRFLTKEEISKLEGFMILDNYLNDKKKELANWNRALEERGAKPVNSRRITNIGTFRIYVEKYLRSRKDINQKMLLIVRQLAPEATGLPLEIYCFTASTAWVEYEFTQSDIFDHLLAILPLFGLRVYQRSSDAQQNQHGFEIFTEE